MTLLEKSMQEKQEIIVGVTITVDGVIRQLPRPYRHHHVIEMVYVDSGFRPVTTEDQGFFTNTGRYLNREEALVVAKKANQLLPRHHHATELFSESVW